MDSKRVGIILFDDADGRDFWQLFDLFGEERWRSIYAGELEVRPPGAPTTVLGKGGRPRRYSAGVKPVRRLNVVVNRLCVPKPHSTAMSASEWCVSLINCFARSMRRSSTNARGVRPADILKARAK